MTGRQVSKAMQMRLEKIAAMNLQATTGQKAGKRRIHNLYETLGVYDHFVATAILHQDIHCKQ
jgi:hypothetical protein